MTRRSILAALAALVAAPLAALRRRRRRSACLAVDGRRLFPLADGTEILNVTCESALSGPGPTLDITIQDGYGNTFRLPDGPVIINDRGEPVAGDPEYGTIRFPTSPGGLA